MTATISRDDANRLIQHISSTLIVKQLQAILKAEGQPTSGLKNPLQKRLINHIENIVKGNDAAGFQRVKALVHGPEAAAPPRPMMPINGFSPVVNNYTPTPNPQPRAAYPLSHPGNPYPTAMNASTRLLFKESPFYTILTPLCDTIRCPAVPTNRSTAKTSVTLNKTQAEQLIADKSLRCMLYCAILEPLTSFTRDTEIAFPNSVEVRVNDKALTGLHLRGLKNKPGSTLPADITDSLTKTHRYRNEVSLTYALTQKDFGFLVYLVKVDSVDQLVGRLKAGNSISRDTVTADIRRRNEDSDIVTTATVMSLKCPLSTLRIELPVRSSFCTHIQCFDACSFLQLQMQAPTWTCPTCNKPISFKQLVVDKYFEDILQFTPRTVESVTIDVDGQWSVAAESTNSPFPDSSDEEDSKRDVVEIVDQPGKPNGLSTPVSGREGSAAAGRPITGSNKRPITQVIDLTLSDDDDDPPRPPKRIATANASFPIPSSMTGGSNGLNYSNRSTPNVTGNSPVWNPDPLRSIWYR